MRTACRLAVCGVLLAAIAGCTRAPSSTPSTSPTLTTSSSEPAPSDSTTAPTTSAASSASGGTSTPTATPTKTVPAPPSDACATRQLAITVERGSGTAGHQFATILFKNTSTAKCSLIGFPGVVLLKGGATLGRPANRSTTQFATVRLAPGATGTATLTNDSTCNADNSDSVQVIVPDRTEKVVLPLRMRGCPLTIDPVAGG
jgi:hypothetical protein